VAARDGRVSGQNLRCTDGMAQGMMVRSSSHARQTHVEGAMTIMKDVALAPKGPVPRHLGRAVCNALLP
jgi:hypothetical protein